jgi:hypothetical protein
MNILPKIVPSDTILFVGAGISTLLGLPSWSQLVEEIGLQLGYDPRIFQLLGQPLALAEYYQLERGGLGGLRSWMDVKWHESTIDVSNSEVHKAIVCSGFKKIYTTNFDRWIERACERWEIPHRKIVTVNDMIIPQDPKLEIVKFHGDFDDDQTLVLTETSYFDRLDFESPLDQMLRYDVLRSPFLFIGYSLSDLNVRYLFHKLAKIWELAGLKSARPESFIYMMNPNPVEEKIFKKWGIAPVVDPEGKPQGVGEFLRNLARA